MVASLYFNLFFFPINKQASLLSWSEGNADRISWSQRFAGKLFLSMFIGGFKIQRKSHLNNFWIHKWSFWRTFELLQKKEEKNNKLGVFWVGVSTPFQKKSFIVVSIQRKNLWCGQLISRLMASPLVFTQNNVSTIAYNWWLPRHTSLIFPPCLGLTSPASKN